MANNIDSIGRMESLASIAQMSKELSAESPENKRYCLLRIDEVVSHEQVRKRFEDLEGLADSIKELGVQVPINVRERTRDGKYVIIQGERRWRAAKMAGLTKIPAIVDTEEVDEQTSMLMQLTENIQRDDMRPMEIAAALKVLSDSGLTGREIAKRLGRSHVYVHTYLSLADLPDFLRELAESESIKDPTTLLQLRRAYDANPETAEKAIRDALDENGFMSRAKAKGILHMIRGIEEGGESAGTPSPEASAEPAQDGARSVPDAAETESAWEGPAGDASGTPEAYEGTSGPDEAFGGVSAKQEGEEAAKPSPSKKPAEPHREAKPEHAPVLPAGMSGKIRLVPMSQVRIWVEMVMQRHGTVIVEEGWLANNAVPNEEGKFCVILERGGSREMHLVGPDEINLLRTTVAEE